MTIKARLASILLGATLLAPFAPSAQAQTLADAMAGAYSHSGILEQNRALLRVADERVAQARAALRPILNYTASAARSYVALTDSYSDNATVSINMSLLLWDWGSSKAEVEAQKQSVLSTRSQLVSLEQSILLNAVSAFMDVRRNSEILALRQNNLRLITRELRAAEDRFEVGEVTRTDVATAEARLAEARAALASAQGDYLQAQVVYEAVVGRKPGNLHPPQRFPRTASSLENAISVAIQGHPDMEAAKYNIAVADIRISQAVNAIKPTVSLSGNIGRTNNLDSGSISNSRSLAVTATGPIYQGGALASTRRQAIAQRDAAMGALHNTRHVVRQNVGIAWSQVLSARAQTVASRRQIAAAQVAFDGVREESLLGSRTTLDVLNAEQELLNARANAISAQSNEFVAAYSLLAAMGLLTVDHLNLAVEKFDPEAYYNQVKNAPALTSKQGRQLDRVLRAIGKE